MITLTLTPEQFKELKVQVDAVAHARGLGIKEGEVKNTLIDSEWTENEIKIEVDI